MGISSRSEEDLSGLSPSRVTTFDLRAVVARFGLSAHAAVRWMRDRLIPCLCITATLLAPPVVLLAGPRRGAETFVDRDELAVFAEASLERYGIAWDSRQNADGSWTVLYDRREYERKAGGLSARLSEVEDTLAGLALTCAPTFADGRAVEAALARLVADIGGLPGAPTSSDRVQATETERRSIALAYDLSQVLGFVFDQLDWYVEHAASIEADQPMGDPI